MSRVSILPRRGSGATLGRRSSAPISAPSLRGFLHCRGDGLIWAGADVRLLRNRSGEPEGRGRRDLPPARRALDGPNGAQSPRCGGRLLARKAVPPRGPRPAVHEGVSGSSHPSRDQGSATSGEEPEPERVRGEVRAVGSQRVSRPDHSARRLALAARRLRVSEALPPGAKPSGAGECADRFVAGSQRQLQGASPPTAGRAPQLLPPRSGLKESTEYRHSTPSARGWSL